MADETGTTEARRPTAVAPSFSRFLMIFLFLLGFWTLFDPTLAAGFAAVAAFLLVPIIGFGGLLPVITILLAGMLTTTISSLLRDYFTDWVKMARTQKIMRALQRERLDALRKGNTAKVAKLVEFQKTFQKDMMDVQFAPMKSMALTLFMFIVIFNWLRVFVDESIRSLGNQWIAVPWSSNVDLLAAYGLPSWLLLYSLLAIPFGQVVSRLLKYVRFRRRLLEMGVPLQADAGEAA